MAMGGLIPTSPPFSSLFLPPPPSLISLRPSRRHHHHHHLKSVGPIACSSSSSDIDLFLNPLTNTYTSHQSRAVILWDLDNKPPRGPPYNAALSLRRLPSLFNLHLHSFSAYANRHAFLHLPPWVLNQRRQQRHLQTLERKGLSIPSQPYLCHLCGRKFPTQINLKKHFKQLHERERNKKLSRMRSLKGKKRQKYKERFVSGNVRYEEAARDLLTPKTGYGLASELRRAGVFVKTVEDKPQAADSALKRQIMHWMGSGVDWLFLVSDDSDFREMVLRAREREVQTVVVGDGRRALGREADMWVSWMRVESGEVEKEEVMRSRNTTRGDEIYDDEGTFLSQGSRFYESGDGIGDDELLELDSMVDEIVTKTSSSKFGADGYRMSAFSEEDVGVNLGEDSGNNRFGVFGSDLFGDDDLFTDSEGEEEQYYI